MLPKIKKIVYGTALSAGAPYVFNYALSLAQQYDARIFVVHAMEPLSPFAQSLVETYLLPETNVSIHQQNVKHVQESLQAKLDQFCKEGVCYDSAGQQRIESARVVEGKPEEAIVGEAKRVGADLIVIGTHRHSVTRDALLGSTANRVMHESAIPVLLVRIPEGFTEEGV